MLALFPICDLGKDPVRWAAFILDPPPKKIGRPCCEPPEASDLEGVPLVGAAAEPAVQEAPKFDQKPSPASAPRTNGTATSACSKSLPEGSIAPRFKSTASIK